MGILDWFRRRRRSADGGVESTAPSLRELTARVRDRYGAPTVRAFRAVHPGLAHAELTLAGEPPFEWVESSYLTGPVVTTVRMVWTGSEAVELDGVDGLRALLRQGRDAGLAFEELVPRVARLVHLQVHHDRATVARLCDPAGDWAAPASPAFLERFHPPRTDEAGMVFFAEATARPFVIMASNRTTIVRVTVERDTLTVRSEEIGLGVQHRSPFDPGGQLPPGIAMPGRALVTDDGAVVTAPCPTSASAEAARWREQALGEHASVASFSRAVLELMAAGAPLDLLERVHEAALDELRHTRQCLEVARRLDGLAVSLGPVPALAPRPGTLADLARRTRDEAAAPETVAARTLASRAAAATDPHVRAILAAQAADEARHARLALDIIAWCAQPTATR